MQLTEKQKSWLNAASLATAREGPVFKRATLRRWLSLPYDESIRIAESLQREGLVSLLPTDEAILTLLDTRVIYCGDNLEQARQAPRRCVDLIYIDPPFNSNRNYEVFWGETKEKRAFEDRHASTQAYIDYMRPAASNSPACSRRPAASTTTATGTPRIT
jgi:hypothetical protein